jgi:hypothetical protein
MPSLNHFTKKELKAITRYQVTWDKDKIVHLLYCKRCLELVDVTPFKANIEESMIYHDKMHILGGIDYTSLLGALHEVQLLYEEAVTDHLEMFGNDFRWHRVHFWQEALGVDDCLEITEKHLSLC